MTLGVCVLRLWMVTNLFDLVLFAVGTGTCSREGIPCDVYSYKNEACMLPQLSAAHPGLYHDVNEGDILGPPGSINAMIYESNTFYGLNITFTPPRSGNMSNLEGFELRYVNSRIVGESCRIVDLRNQILMQENREMVFNLTLSPVQIEATYFLILKCLPMSATSLQPYIFLSITVPYKRNVSLAMDWSTSISFRNKSDIREVELVFTKPPAEFNFIEFEVTLMPLPSTEQWRKIRNKTHDFHYTFEDVIPGQYLLQVKPVDDFTGNCICRSANGICQQCITTETAPFFIYNVSTTTATSTTTTTKTTSTQTTTSQTTTSQTTTSQTTISTPFYTAHASDDLNTLKIVLAVIGSVLGVGIILVFGWLYREKRSPKAIQYFEDNHPGKLQQSPVTKEDAESVVTVSIKRRLDSKQRISLSRKKVLILYTEDHECHEKVVECFVSYLQFDCNCDVMYAPWNMDGIRHDGPSFWIQQSLNSAECVIIINSEAAFKIVEADKERKAFHPIKSSPYSSSLFLPGIKLVTSKFIQNHQYNKFIMVRFDYTSESYVLKDICPGLCYCLTTHYTEFLCHIHGLTQNHDFTLFDLPLDTNQFERGKGLKLLDAVKKAQKYETQHPKWFSEKFGSPRIRSTYSDDEKNDSGLGRDILPYNQIPQYLIQDGSLNMQISQQHLSDTDQFHVPEYHSYMEIFTIHPEDVGIFPTEHNEYEILKPQDGYRNVESPRQCPGLSEFIPPSEIADDDIMSRTISEQVQSINNRYMAQKFMDYDNYLLQVQMGNIHEPKALDFETQSLGGQSV